MMATSIPPSSSKSTPPPPPPAARAPHAERNQRSFQCTDELWRAFAARAAQLECSPDWLLSEAMKRLLESGPKPNAPTPSDRGTETRKSKSLPPIRPPERRPTPPPPPPPPREAREAPQPQPLVLIVNGKRTTIDVVQKKSFVIGRSQRDAQLVLRDPGVSRQHAIVERFGAAYVIVDMASTNGVIVNGMRVARCVLRTHDVITIGPFTIEVERGTMV